MWTLFGGEQDRSPLNKLDYNPTNQSTTRARIACTGTLACIVTTSYLLFPCSFVIKSSSLSFACFFRYASVASNSLPASASTYQSQDEEKRRLTPQVAISPIHRQMVNPAIDSGRAVLPFNTCEGGTLDSSCEMLD